MASKTKLFGLLGAALALAAVAWPLYQRFMGRGLLRFPYLARPLAEASYSGLAAKPGWAKAKLRVAPDVELHGLVRRPSSKAAPWVLFYPGNDESQLERGQSFLIGLGGELDWGLAVFGYRGYDRSQGKAELAGIRADAPEILSQLCANEGLAPGQVHVIGFSIGGHVAVHAVGGAAQRGRRAATLSLLASVDDIVMYQRSPWEKLSPGDNYDTMAYLGAVPEPVLVVQGTADSAFHGPAPGRNIAAALGGKARYEELPGADHVPLLKNEQALQLLRGFIGQAR